MRVWIALLMLGNGCGRIAFDVVGTETGASDAESGDGSSSGDAAALGPFGTPSNVVELNPANVNSEDPTLTGDLREIVFSSTRLGGIGGVDLWTATRGAAADAWGTPVLVPNVNTTSDETTPEITTDGLALVFASSRTGGAGLYDLYVSTRNDRASAWGAPVRIVELATSSDEFAGSLSADRLRFLFSSSRPGGLGMGDVWLAVRATTGDAWGTPVPLVEINSGADDSAPWSSDDGLTLLLSSTRTGGEGMQDVWITTRATTGDPWQTPTAIAELNDIDYDSDPWLSPDQRTIVYSRLQSSFRNIFIATR